MASSNKPDNATSGLGLKGFNRTGREDTTTEVLRPKVARPNGVLIAVVVVAFIVVAFIAFTRSGLDPREITADSGKSFGAAADAAQHQQNVEDKGN